MTAPGTSGRWKISGPTVNHDDNGNVTQIHVTVSDPDPAVARAVTFTYHWDHYNRLVRAERSQSGQLDVLAEHRYDSDGRRVMQGRWRQPSTVRTTLYVSDVFEIRDFDEVTCIGAGRGGRTPPIFVPAQPHRDH